MPRASSDNLYYIGSAEDSTITKSCPTRVNCKLPVNLPIIHHFFPKITDLAIMRCLPVSGQLTCFELELKQVAQSDNS